MRSCGKTPVHLVNRDPGFGGYPAASPLLFINTLRPRQNGRHFADDPFKRIFLNETLRISIKISLNFVPKGPINDIPALVQIMAWRRPGDKPLSEPMMVSLLTHICVTRPQWVKDGCCVSPIDWGTSSHPTSSQIKNLAIEYFFYLYIIVQFCCILSHMI